MVCSLTWTAICVVVAFAAGINAQESAGGYTLMEFGTCPKPYQFIDTWEVPHGCYFYPSNQGNYKLFWNPSDEGKMDAKDDTTRLSLCNGEYTTSTTTTTTSTTTIPKDYSLMRSGSCPSPFAFIESLQECSAAARALDLVDKTASRISTTVPNNRAEVPHGCYFFQSNPGAKPSSKYVCKGELSIVRCYGYFGATCREDTRRCDQTQTTATPSTTATTTTTTTTTTSATTITTTDEANALYVATFVTVQDGVHANKYGHIKSFSSTGKSATIVTCSGSIDGSNRIPLKSIKKVDDIFDDTFAFGDHALFKYGDYEGQAGTIESLAEGGKTVTVALPGK
eukprot:gene6843-19024_t